MKKRQSFSLIEMTITIALLALLMSLLLPSFNKFKEFSNSVNCKNNLNFLYTATIIYVEDNDGVVPGPILIGQYAKVEKFNLSKYFEPYCEQSIGTDGSSKIVMQLICPSSTNANIDIKDDLRLHYRSHIEKYSRRHFGYPTGKTPPISLNLIQNHSKYGYLKDVFKLEYEKKRKPGWYSILSETPPHFSTDFNMLTLDGSVKLINFYFEEKLQ